VERRPCATATSDSSVAASGAACTDRFRVITPPSMPSPIWTCPAAPAAPALAQGLTLVHFSPQFERFLWDMGCA